MNGKRSAGYREIEHTADWELEVWAPTLESLFEQAARGMAKLAGERLRGEERVERRLELQSADTEGLLVAFLTELLFLSETQNLGFDQYEIKLVGENLLTAQVSGTPLSSIDKEIKAVTYHNLKIRTTPTGREVRLVFDV